MTRQYKQVFLLILILFIGGTLGYYLIEGWSFLDSFYMTVITLSTTGYKEVYPLSHPQAQSGHRYQRRSRQPL